MKDPWFLAASEAEIESQTALDYYAARWSIETGFRDYKDPRFGMGLGTISTDNPERRDKLILIGAIGIYFLNLVGSASKMENIDRKIRYNTKHEKIMHSRFIQGSIIVYMMFTMHESWMTPFMQRFKELLLEKKKRISPFFNMPISKHAGA